MCLPVIRKGVAEGVEEKALRVAIRRRHQVRHVAFGVRSKETIGHEGPARVEHRTTTRRPRVRRMHGANEGTGLPCHLLGLGEVTYVHPGVRQIKRGSRASQGGRAFKVLSFGVHGDAQRGC